MACGFALNSSFLIPNYSLALFKIKDFEKSAVWPSSRSLATT